VRETVRVDSLKGKLVIAAPALIDPNFARTVVLIVDHDEHGAMGIVLNRVADADLAEAVPDLADVPEIDELLFVGGPVQDSNVLLLGDFSDLDKAAPLVAGSIGMVGADTELTDLADTVSRARAFAGYAGWSAGQLEAEVQEEAWITADPVPDDLLTDAPDDLWSATLYRKGGWHRVIAQMPADPSLN
jgi:putative transcriptional regulator